MAEAETDKNICSNDSTPKKSVPVQQKEDHTVLDSLQELAESNLDNLQDSVSESDSKDKYVPGPFPKEGKSLTDIKQNLLSIISQCEADDDEELLISSMRPKKCMDSDVQKAALLSHTMAAYISTLNKSLVRRLAVQLVSDTTLWLSEIFRFPDSLTFFSKDSIEGLIPMIRRALLCKYRRYCSAGYEVLFTRPPVIYYCDMQGQGIGKHISYLCSQLGLPLSSVTSVPCLSTSSIDGKYKMDPSILEKYIKDDISATKTPLIVLANAGSPLLGYLDNLQKIYEICAAHDVWLHLHGHLLSGLSLLTEPKVPSIPGDSLSLCLGEWIGLPSLPYITLYREKDMSHSHEAGLDQALQGNLDFLPVWVTIQSFGQANLIQRIQHCFTIGDKLLETIENCPELRIVSKRKIVSKDNPNPDMPVSIMAMLESLTPVIVFQYTATEIKEKDLIEPNPPYYDNLNSWLIQVLSREVPNIKTDILDLEEFGLCLRICPFESVNVLGTTEEDANQYYYCLKQQIAILSSTAHQREKLYAEYKNHRKLQLVDIVDWAGLGAVRYIPEFWVDRLNELTDTGKADINHLNSEIVAKLKAYDSAFSVGETEDGMICVRFGMVDDNSDLVDLIDHVINAGEELEESSKFLETMSEMIKHGIEEANKELIQENNEKIMQEGILRQVPVLGSLVSWWYPTASEPGIKGRSFNLSSGTIESTENIYKYHMQIKEGGAGSKSPPTTAKVLVPSNSSQNSLPADQNSNTSANR